LHHIKEAFYLTLLNKEPSAIIDIMINTDKKKYLPISIFAIASIILIGLIISYLFFPHLIGDFVTSQTFISPKHQSKILEKLPSRNIERMIRDGKASAISKNDLISARQAARQAGSKYPSDFYTQDLLNASYYKAIFHLYLSHSDIAPVFREQEKLSDRPLCTNNIEEAREWVSALQKMLNNKKDPPAVTGQRQTEKYFEFEYQATHSHNTARVHKCSYIDTSHYKEFEKDRLVVYKVIFGYSNNPVTGENSKEITEYLHSSHVCTEKVPGCVVLGTLLEEKDDKIINRIYELNTFWAPSITAVTTSSYAEYRYEVEKESGKVSFTKIHLMRF
jgi:hypothetical protein